ncbi:MULTISPECIES: hypothetical protein [unclassified Rhizobium]|uniref:hypothetical protein n=1 Tax=unclassified Rhizobium TaxID=2613769 RepID=UPI0007EB3F87|nr:MULTISPECIES: hypothetical protein [unclassified Rhizobium]
MNDLRSAFPPVVQIIGKLRDRISIHEAGHVVVGLALDVGILKGAVVRSGFRSDAPIGGGVVFEPDARLLHRQYLLDDIAMSLAGMAAEQVFFNEHLEGSGDGDGSDLHRAANLATLMAAQFGMGTSINHFKAANPADREVIRRTLPAINRFVEGTLAAQLERAKRIVEENMESVREIAAILYDVGVVDGDQARALFQKRGRPDVD